MVPVAVDGPVAGLEDDIDLVDGVELVVEAVLAVEDNDEADLSNWPNQWPKNGYDGENWTDPAQKGLILTLFFNR